jgi:hypothetical protein
MNRMIPRIVGLWLCSSLAQAQVLSPQDFAYGQMVVPAENASAARFAVPLSVYENTFREDLADLRVFNAEGSVVPFSLSRSTAQSPLKKDSIGVPLFPLREGARVLMDGVHLTINSGGSAVNLQTQNGTRAQSLVRQYLIDARALDTRFEALQLGWPETASEYTGRLSLEVSEDLASWHSVVLGAPIANLHANGQSLIENRISFAPTQAKFWRLTWLGAPPTFDLGTVFAEPATKAAEPVREEMDVIGVRDPVNGQEFVFDLSAHPPVSRLNVLLPDLNTVIDVELLSRAEAKNPWRTVARSGFYRIKAADAEQRNSPIEISSDSDRFWLARIVNTGVSPQAGLRLQVEWAPDEVTFLVQGHAPYLLVYGNASAKRGESDLSRLPASLEIAPATLGPRTIVGGPARLIQKPAAFPRTRILLWGVLLIAVIGLALMAYHVSKESINPADSPNG